MWTINTQLFYKIWFSANPECFLGFENELRFIRFRNQNPKATIHFIYSSKILSETALDKMAQFCHRHRIQPVDFNALKPLLEDTSDKFLYDIAAAEIKHALSNQGGNLAAASDCARLIVPIIERYGIYSDFDVEINFSQLPEKISVHFPIICDVLKNETPSFTNEFLAFALEDGRISIDGLKRLHMLQKSIIDRYQVVTPATFADNPQQLNLHMEVDKQYNIFIKKYTELNPKSSVFDFRYFVTKMDIFTFYRMNLQVDPEIISFFLTNRNEQDKLNSLIVGQHNLLMLSVMNVSGPNNYLTLYNMNSREEHMQELSDSSYLKNGLNELIKKSNYNLRFFVMPMGQASDISWTPEGVQQKQERTRELIKAGKTVLKAMQRKCKALKPAKKRRFEIVEQTGKPIKRLK